MVRSHHTLWAVCAMAVGVPGIGAAAPICNGAGARARGDDLSARMRLDAKAVADRQLDLPKLAARDPARAVALAPGESRAVTFTPGLDSQTLQTITLDII